MTGQRKFAYAANGRKRLDPSPADSVRLGRYEVHGTLGRGAMSTVYLGWDPVNARRVAIRTVRIPNMESAGQQEELDRFWRQAQPVGRLRHPNIVGVLDYGETDEVAFIVMDFVDGRTLQSILDQGGALPLDAVLEIMTGLLAGLQYSHEKGVIHRDIKPANIIIAGHEEPTRDKVRITDFGIARIENSAMSHMGALLGTPAYMSPEQHTGEPIDERTDLYSAAVVMFHLLTGQRPFDGSLITITHQVLYAPPPRASGFARAVPASLDAVVSQAMARRPQNRFQNAEAFAVAMAVAFRTAQDQSTAPKDAAGEVPPEAARPFRAEPALPSRYAPTACAPTANASSAAPVFKPSRLRRQRRSRRKKVAIAASVAVGALGTWALASVQPSVLGDLRLANWVLAAQAALGELVQRHGGPAASPSPIIAEAGTSAGGDGGTKAAAAGAPPPVPMPVMSAPATSDAISPAVPDNASTLAGTPDAAAPATATSGDQPARLDDAVNSPDTSPAAGDSQVSAEAPPTAAPADEAERHQILEGLTRLGHYTGGPDSEVGPDARFAIRQYQLFHGHPETGDLTDSERNALAWEARDMAALLTVPERSPRGQPASAAPGNEEQRQQGWIFETGNTGQKVDLAEATYWYALSAAQGNGAAMLALGNMKMRGKGLPKPDPAAARALWLAAAARGEPGANYNLGVATERGIGIEANLEASLFWYRRAAALNSNDAILALKRLER